MRGPFTLAGQIAAAKAAIAAAQSQAASINAQSAQLNSSYQARTAVPANPVPMGPLPGESAIASDLQGQATACLAAAGRANQAARQAFQAAGAAFAGLADRSKANGTNWIDQGGSLAAVGHGLYHPGRRLHGPAGEDRTDQRESERRRAADGGHDHHPRGSLGRRL